MKYADFGTVSHGTLRDADLLRSFGDELEYHVKRNAKALDKNTRKRYLALVKEAAGLNPDDASDDEFEFVLDLVHGLMDALDKFSPPDGYFGPHPGDGADFGFWPSEDNRENVP